MRNTENSSADATLNTAPGAAVHRGPMSVDHFTQIHNLVVRGKTPIQTRYVGVWGFITSHTEGWRLTEVGIARELGVGRGFVRSALQAIEAAGCLIRTQQRESTGQMSAGVWFVTDLPIQMQQLGITDPDIVNAKVQEAYEAWLAERFPSSSPMSDNSTSATTCDDEDHQGGSGDSDQGFPSAVPMSSYPTSGKPTSENRTPKKTKVQKTKVQNTNQPTDVVGWAADAEGEEPASASASPTDVGAPDSDGVRILRSLPLGVGSKIAGHAIERWAPVVAAALRAGMDKKVVIDKLTAGLPSDDLDQRVRIVVGHRLPDLKETVEEASAGSGQRRQSALEQAHARVDRLAAAKDRGAREAAGLLGRTWEPEHYRGNASAQEWITEILPRVSQEFVEQHRDALVAAMTSRQAA